MKPKICSLFLRCAVGAFGAGAIATPALAAPIRASAVSCVVPNMWKQEPRVDIASLEGPRAMFDVAVREPASVYAAAAPTASSEWTVKYKGTGYDRMRGAARDRVASFGVLWTVEPGALGISSQKAISELLNAGAVIARPDDDGTVYFRARESEAQDIANRVASKFSKGLGSRRPLNEQSNARASMIQASAGQQPGTVKLAFSGGMTTEVAMLRMEGRLSSSPAAFIDHLPSANVTIYPFGTSFVVHVPPRDFDVVRDFLADQGNSILLVGATGDVEPGLQVGSGIRACGGNVLADRFPTPKVIGKSAMTMDVDVEGQPMRVQAGDMVLVVQTPAWGRGLEVALMRFGSV